MRLLRVSILRVLAIALGLVLVDVNIFGYEIIPDLIGLTLLFFCAVLFTDRAGRFARTAVVAALMVFIEVVRVFSLAEADGVVMVLSLLYTFLHVLLVITAADGVAQFSQLQGDDRVPRLCDLTGHVYALTFVCVILGGWFADLTMILNLIYYIITGFTVVMFVYFYSAVHTPLQDHELPFFDAWQSGEGMEDLEGVEEAEPVEPVETDA
jgi:hypothetical protein